MEISNTFISAVAGSGKTERLANRFIEILRQSPGKPDGGKVLPGEIVALTFSRAAAGEIFQRIVMKLSGDANGKDGKPGEDAAVRLKILRDVIASQHKSQVGTIDSFIKRLVDLLPSELGLQGPVELMDDYAAEKARKDVLRELLSDADAIDSLEKQLQMSRDGAQDVPGKSWAAEVENLAGAYAGLYADDEAFRNPEAWNARGKVWPAAFDDSETGRLLDGSGKPLGPEALAKMLEDAYGECFSQLFEEERTKSKTEEKSLREKQEAWRKVVDFVREFRGFNNLPTEIKNIVESLSVRKKKFSDFNLCRKAWSVRTGGVSTAMLYRVFVSLFALELEWRIDETAALFGVVKAYSDRYDAAFRSQGKIGFDELPRLMERLPESRRRAIGYLLDTRLRHWELDEFQDTNRAQWNALRSLFGEKALSGGNEDESVLIVGDEKQAIYGWRGGDVKIFNGIANDTRFMGEKESMTESRRFGPAIAELVNRLSIPWKGCTHTGNPELKGKDYAEVTVLAGEKSKAEAKIPAVVEKIAEEVSGRKLLSREVVNGKAGKRPLTVAVLVRGNENGRRIVNGLNEKGVPAVWEGDTPVLDTPVVACLLAALRLCDFPEDRFARSALKYAPLRAIRGISIDDLRADIFKTSLSGALRELVGKITGELEKNGQNDRRIADRLSALVQAADEYEKCARREFRLGEFVRFAERRMMKNAGTDVVHVMTIHHSKGLTFDVVFVPELENAMCSTPGFDQSPLVSEDRDWVLKHCGSDLKRILAEGNEKVAATLEAEARMRFEEEICARYVALTRPRYALYLMVFDAGKEDSPGLDFKKAFSKDTPLRDLEKLKFSALILNSLGGLDREKWAVSKGAPTHVWSGTENWYENFEEQVPSVTGEDARAAVEPEGEISVPVPTVRIVRRRPSDHSQTSEKMASVLGRLGPDLPAAGKGGRGESPTERGTRIHAEFEKIGWADETVVAGLLPEGVKPSADFMRAFTEPYPKAPLWREKSFELLEEGENGTMTWTTGQFDRVVFSREGGGPRAVIYDFKTNVRQKSEATGAMETDEEMRGRLAETYASQMAQYRNAVTALTGIADVESYLLSTELGDVIKA